MQPTRGSTGARPGAPPLRPALVLTAMASAGCALTLGACGGHATAPTTPGVVRVVAGENPWGSIVSQLGGRHVQVTSIVTDPSADPHLYESNAADALAVAQARLVIENGAGYDGFLDKLLSVTTNAGRTVLSVQHVLGAGLDANPHFWYDLPRIPEVASAIAAALAKLDPRDAGVFSTNLAGFDRALVPVDGLVARIMRTHGGAPVAYTERLPGYLLHAAGLVVRTPPGFATAIENGNDPSPQDTAAMNELVAGRQIKVLLYDAQAASTTTQTLEGLARREGIPVVALTETLPRSFGTYQVWQLHQTEALLGALGG